MKRNTLVGLGLALLVGLTGCSLTGTQTNQNADSSVTLRVLAGSEVKDMAPIMAKLEAATGVHVSFDYTGTLEGTQAVASGAVSGKYDATWFPSDRYLSLLPGGPAAVKHETKIMSSPVVLGVKEGVAAKLGWDTKTPTWAEIVSAVKAGSLTYGMTSPVSSNSGFSTLIEAATALSGTGTVLTPDNIATVAPDLKALFKGQTVTSGSSGWLADKFTSSPKQADAIFNYESILKSLNVEGKPLTIVAPSDGVITADYPLTLLSSAAKEKEALYNKVVSYLNKASTQEEIHTATLRRTAATNQSSTATAFELPFPNKLDTVQALISAYLSEIKKPSNITFTVDTSGSMGGDRITGLKKALSMMVDANGNNSFVTFNNREKITYVEFSDRIKSEKTFTINSSTRASDMTKVQDYINILQADGGTAIYDALKYSYQKALASAKADPDTFTSIVLFTDGINNAGYGYDQFKKYYNNLRKTDPKVKTIPTYVVLFGEGDTTELTDLSALTGGKAFDALSGNLTPIFKEIRGYQ